MAKASFRLGSSFIDNNTVKTNIYDKRDSFHFEIVIFPFPYADIPRNYSYGVYISLLIRYVIAYTKFYDF